MQLLNFQRAQERIGGEIEGLATLEDLLEEIVGQFTTDPTDYSPDVHPQPDGTFLVDGSAFVRELNRTMQWELPTEGPRTMNGLIVEFLGAIPEPGTSLMIAGYPIEILQTIGNTVRTARINPAERRIPGSHGDRPHSSGAARAYQSFLFSRPSSPAKGLCVALPEVCADS